MYTEMGRLALAAFSKRITVRLIVTLSAAKTSTHTDFLLNVHINSQTFHIQTQPWGPHLVSRDIFLGGKWLKLASEIFGNKWKANDSCGQLTLWIEVISV